MTSCATANALVASPYRNCRIANQNAIELNTLIPAVAMSAHRSASAVPNERARWSLSAPTLNGPSPSPSKVKNSTAIAVAVARDRSCAMPWMTA